MTKLMAIHWAWIYKFHSKANQCVLHVSPENIIIGIYIKRREDRNQDDLIHLCIPGTENSVFPTKGASAWLAYPQRLM